MAEKNGIESSSPPASPTVKVRKVRPPGGINGLLQRRVSIGQEYDCDPDLAAKLCRYGEFEPASKADRAPIEEAAKRLRAALQEEEARRKQQEKETLERAAAKE